MNFAAVVLVFSLAIAGSYAQTCTNCGNIITTLLNDVSNIVINLQTSLQPLLAALGGIGTIVNILLSALVLIIKSLGGLLTGTSGINSILAGLTTLINSIVGLLGGIGK